ncbi:MAG: hypothetical protein WA966_05840 [Ornithinimicrobium sp.]
MSTDQRLAHKFVDQHLRDRRRLEDVEQNCPAWCAGGHTRAFDDGSAYSEAAPHDSRVLSGPQTGSSSGWEVSLRSTQVLGKEPDVCLSIQHQGDERAAVGLDARLTTGDCRTLARHLNYLADLEDGIA